MSEEYTRRGRNWKTAMGVLFLVVAAVTLVRDIIIWSPDFVVEFFFNSDVNAQKISLGSIAFGMFMIVWGYKKPNVKTR
jgi:hypothetical protein|tara:strand:- start:133 stop:369 length:237 start_codon:yes stop_codon:yes gene_type:complete